MQIQSQLIQHRNKISNREFEYSVIAYNKYNK